MAKNKSTISINIAEFLEENVQELTTHMKWMEGRTLRCAENLEEVKIFIDQAIQAGRCVIDLETTGLNTRTRKACNEKIGIPLEKIVSFGLSYDSKFGLHVPIGHQVDPELNLPEAEILHEIRRLCANCITIYHNAKFDLQFLKNYGVAVDDFKKFEDTQLLARLFDAGQKSTKLKEVSDRLLNQPMIEYEEIAPDKKFQLISPKIGYVYGASDAVCTMDLYNFLMAQQIITDQKSIYNLEKRVVFVVMEMEANLIKIDVPYLRGLQIEASKKIKEIEKEIQHLAGHDFNVGSTQQLGKVLFDELKFRYPEKEMTAGSAGHPGQYKTDDKTLEKIADEYPIVKKIMEFRGLQKSLGTYIENLLNNCDENGCIKLGFHQSGTDTGRFSSPGGEGLKFDGYSGVNVQSIPKDTEGGMPDIRRAFIPRTGYTIVAADYENEEMRVATNLSNETAWIDAVNAGIDFHTKTASIITGKPFDQITKPDRKKGKTVNFLALYLGGPMALAAQAKISIVEAKKILAAYFSGVPNLKKWMDSTIAHARKSKLVKTAFGRIRPLATYYDSQDKWVESHGDRCAVNTKVQGVCADIMKTVMVRIYNWIHLNNLQDDIRILITMHDELVFEIKTEKLGLYIPKIAKIMMLSDLLQDQLKWPLPLTVDVKYGESWRVTKKFFDDFPELKKNIDDPLDFHYSGQITASRYSIALGRTTPDVAGDAVSDKSTVEPPVEVKKEPEPIVVPVSTPEPVKAPESPVEVPTGSLFPENPVTPIVATNAYDITMTDEQYQRAVKVGTRRYEESKKMGLRQAYGAAGYDLNKDILGASGELAYCLYTDQSWSESVNTFKAPDVGTNIQVRTTPRTGRLIVRDRDKDDEIYVLIIADGKRFKIAGSMLGRDAKQEKFLDAPDPSRPPCYCVSPEFLTKVEKRIGSVTPVIAPVIETAPVGPAGIDLNDLLGTYVAPVAAPVPAVPVSDSTALDSTAVTLPAVVVEPALEPVVTEQAAPSLQTEEFQAIINENELIYTIRDRRKSTLRRLNDILTFLLLDEIKYNSYQSPKKILRIKDPEGNSMRVSEDKIPIDPFLSLARYFGI